MGVVGSKARHGALSTSGARLRCLWLALGQALLLGKMSNEYALYVLSKRATIFPRECFKGALDRRLDASCYGCSSRHGKSRLAVDRFDEQLQTDSHRIGLHRFPKPLFPAIHMAKWIRGLPSKDAALWRASKARILAQSCWFGACCIEWVFGSGCTEKTSRALPTSSCRSTRPRFSFMDVFGMATVVRRASCQRVGSNSGVRRSNGTSAVTLTPRAPWSATAGASPWFGNARRKTAFS